MTCVYNKLTGAGVVSSEPLYPNAARGGDVNRDAVAARCSKFFNTGTDTTGYAISKVITTSTIDGNLPGVAYCETVNKDEKRCVVGVSVNGVNQKQSVGVSSPYALSCPSACSVFGKSAPIAVGSGTKTVSSAAGASIVNTRVSKYCLDVTTSVTRTVYTNPVTGKDVTSETSDVCSSRGSICQSASGTCIAGTLVIDPISGRNTLCQLGTVCNALDPVTMMSVQQKAVQTVANGQTTITK
jgi:hypothetical protein